ncbi:hypothetical protein ONO86_02964 [Micromonospora noduli]|uniref:hypothetical protein n=1 Tax=Micromonospora noduli TaxID=709876 RepID=UPI000DC4DFB5|nr:hypothetical protein [Micromonospora noduli]RAO47417.1 hypothetical protein ONO86_02964 [Micromonospora noduli]
MPGPRRDGPSPRDARLSGLEAWLTGTPAELDAATAALTDAGHLTQHGTRRPLTGSDAGRYRLYLRLSVAADRQRPTGTPNASGGALIDLAAARASRRPA